MSACLKTQTYQRRLDRDETANMSYEEAAAGVATGGLTALNLLRMAKIQKGQDVLIYGASGSVGTFAVQLAKYYGADVTGVCSTTNLDMVKSLGADRVLDYTKENFTEQFESYDVVLDAVDKLPKSQGKKTLKKNGISLNVVKDFDSEEGLTTADLIFLKELVEAGRLRTVIDRRYPWKRLSRRIAMLRKGIKRGTLSSLCNTV